MSADKPVAQPTPAAKPWGRGDWWAFTALMSAVMNSFVVAWWASQNHGRLVPSAWFVALEIFAPLWITWCWSREWRLRYPKAPPDPPP